MKILKFMYSVRSTFSCFTCFAIMQKYCFTIMPKILSKNLCNCSCCMFIRIFEVHSKKHYMHNYLYVWSWSQNLNVSIDFVAIIKSTRTKLIKSRIILFLLQRPMHAPLYAETPSWKSWIHP